MLVPLDRRCFVRTLRRFCISAFAVVAVFLFGFPPGLAYPQGTRGGAITFALYQEPELLNTYIGTQTALITESGLNYLGFGVQLPTPTWGNMLRNAQDQIIVAPWTAIFPGVFIFFAVIAINYVGDGLRDALDPRHVR